MRNTWKVLKFIVKANSHIKCSEKFFSENEIYTCPNDIASKFNQYFANIGPKLTSIMIHHEGKYFSSYLQNQSNATCFLKPTSENEILKIIKKTGKQKKRRK